MIITDDSVDVDEMEKLPLYVEWRKRKVRVSSVKRSSYFLSAKRTFVELPYYKEIEKKISNLVFKNGEVDIVLPSWPVNFLKRTTTFVSSILDGVNVRDDKVDNVTLSYVLKSEKPLETIKEFSRSSMTYLLFSDMSVLRKNGVVYDENPKNVMTKSVNLVRFNYGKVQIKSSWSIKGAVSLMMKEITSKKRFMIAVRHSGKSRLANMIATSIVSELGCKVSLGWMNPVAASQYGHGTVTVTVMPEV